MHDTTPRGSALALLLLGLSACVSHVDPNDDPEPRPEEPDSAIQEWVERFESEGREIYDRRGEIVASIGLRRGQTVADIGAGTGLFTPLLSDAVGPSGTVVAVDIDPEFLEYIGRRMELKGRKNVDLVLCDDRSVCLAPESVDVAFLCDVYRHFDHPKSSMSSLFGALRPGGEVIVIDFERIPGVSSEWVLENVRADKETFAAEIRAVGYEWIEEIELLDQSYMLRFQRPE